MKVILIVVFFYFQITSGQELISQTVAQVNNKYLTSRDVILSALISNCQKGDCKESELLAQKIQSDEFAGLLSKAIFERLAYFESVGIFDKVIPLSPQLIDKIRSSKVAQKYKFTKNDIQSSFKIKSLAKEYIKFKDNNLSVYVSDPEALNYFKVNKGKYSSAEFNEVKDVIKKQLRTSRKRRRVEDWVSAMQTKYKVRQLLN